jgi:hypothetical protein
MGERMRKGLKCQVLIRGGRNSILVETEDGERIIASRYAVRLIDKPPPPPETLNLFE